MSVPGHPRDEAFGRHSMSLPFRLPHELLDSDVADDPEVFLRLQEQKEQGALPEAYTSHPV
eukprot:7435462-Alexandrium_andersonii.AAC.1